MIKNLSIIHILIPEMNYEGLKLTTEVYVDVVWSSLAFDIHIFY